MPLLAGLASCNQDSDLGLDLLPDEDGRPVFFTDTLTVRAYTFADEPIWAAGGSVLLLGSIAEQGFGSSRASIITQTRPPSLWLTSNQQPIDSMALFLRFDRDSIDETAYGSPFDAQFLNIYMLSDSLNGDYGVEYLSDSDPEDFYDPANLLARVQVLPFVGDSTLRVSMPQSLVDLFNQGITEQAMDDIEAYRELFPGLAIVPDMATTGGAILPINHLHVTSGLHTYHADGQAFVFPFDGSNIAFSLFEHDFSGTPFEAGLGSAGQQDSVAYLKGMAGLGVLVELPYLESLRGKLLHSVELVVQLESPELTDELRLAPPEELGILGWAGPDSTVFLPEYSGAALVGELLSETEREYRFNITYYVQQYAIGAHSQNRFFLKPPLTKVSPNRAVVRTAAHSSPMRLRATFSDL